ncbi:phosphatidate cytidylyltransferase [Desulfoscipio geothermicus DSM 3669]|uniref:Phosphatidate cytidylyltransferase n=1 Tax=Desulfoscipio geothermicus DSM 3669 TaxID=1121426 RepID=A0A1I6D8D5_9FIRM|nr:phosphatidate cytidylyltransferase [Desulfoscipio geothermicus DSM 3669]
MLAVTAALMLLAAREINHIFSRLNLQVPLFLVIPGCFILLLTAYLFKEGYHGAAVIIVLFACFLSVILYYPRFTPLDASVTFLSIMYLGLFLYFFLLSTLDNGWIWLIVMLVCTWANDTAAYLVGRQWGRRRLAPAVSPGKTVEGAVGGVSGSIMAAFLVTLFYPALPVGDLLVLGALAGLAAQVGDLVESAIKRQACIKDAGRLIPGHGGILDRFDSMLFTAPLVYYYVGLIKIS